MKVNQRRLLTCAVSSVPGISASAALAQEGRRSTSSAFTNWTLDRMSLRGVGNFGESFEGWFKYAHSERNQSRRMTVQITSADVAPVFRIYGAINPSLNDPRSFDNDTDLDHLHGAHHPAERRSVASKRNCASAIDQNLVARTRLTRSVSWRASGFRLSGADSIVRDS